MKDELYIILKGRRMEQQNIIVQVTDAQGAHLVLGIPLLSLR